jgi:hypothetical protein
MQSRGELSAPDVRTSRPATERGPRRRREESATLGPDSESSFIAPPCHCFDGFPPTANAAAFASSHPQFSLRVSLPAVKTTSSLEGEMHQVSSGNLVFRVGLVLLRLDLWSHRTARPVDEVLRSYVAAFDASPVLGPALLDQ